MDEETDQGAVTVLVIDDEPVIHESLKKSLSREGFQVSSALSAREGLQRIESGSFDLIITDLMMPEMDGLEFLDELQRMGVDTPTIMVTGYPTIRTALQALRLGAQDYIPKPFTRKELLSPVRRALRRGRQKGEESPVSEPITVQGSPLPGDRHFLPEHSWAVYDQTGVILVGIEASFLHAVGAVSAIRLPVENDLVEQGYPGMSLSTVEGEEHNIFLPVSGRVIATNREVENDPTQLTAQTWLVHVLPSHLEEELTYLVKG